MDKCLEQILAIRDSGKCNMIDVNRIQREGYGKGFFELVNFIEEDIRAYLNLILYGTR